MKYTIMQLIKWANRGLKFQQFDPNGKTRKHEEWKIKRGSRALKLVYMIQHRKPVRCAIPMKAQRALGMAFPVAP